MVCAITKPRHRGLIDSDDVGFAKELALAVVPTQPPEESFRKRENRSDEIVAKVVTDTMIKMTLVSPLTRHQLSSNIQLSSLMTPRNRGMSLTVTSTSTQARLQTMMAVLVERNERLLYIRYKAYMLIKTHVKEMLIIADAMILLYGNINWSIIFPAVSCFLFLHFILLVVNVLMASLTSSFPSLLF